jgi:hypothetical protein
MSKMTAAGVKSVAAEVSQMSGVPSSNGGLKAVDYTNTRFHTAAAAMVVKHDS